MKRTILILFTSLFILCSGYSQQTIEATINRFSQEEGVQKVKLGRVLTCLVRPWVKELRDLKIKSLKVLDLSDCSDYAKTSFNKTINNLMLDCNDLLMYIKDEDNTVIIATDKRKRRLALLVGGEDPAIIEIKGNFTEKNIQKIVERFNVSN